MHPPFNVISLSREHRVAGPNAALSITMRSEINAISRAVDWLMTMIQECNCVPGHERDVEIGLKLPLLVSIPALDVVAGQAKRAASLASRGLKQHPNVQ